MARRANRRIYLWTLQAHAPEGEYDQLFAALRDLERSRRVAEIGRKKVFLSDVSTTTHGVMFQVYAIRSETDFTTFDISEFTTSDESLPRNKRFAVAAHGFFVEHSRRLFFEYVRGGPKAEETAEAIQQILRSGYSRYRDLRLMITPVVDESFISDVGRLERIRTVRLDVEEPNPGWGDWDANLSDMGEKSNADHVSISATAKRGESLRKNGGILGLLREALKLPNSSLSKAVVTGRLPESSSDTTLRTDQHQRFETRSVATDSGGSSNLIAVRAAFESLPRPRQGERDE